MPPTRIKFRPSEVEAMIGKNLRLPVSLYGRLGGSTFLDPFLINSSVKILNEQVVILAL